MKIFKHASMAACAAAVLVGSMGCASLGARMNGLGLYHEEVYEGRYYVIGTAKTLREFNASHTIPYTMTKVGAGPDHKTVIVEADVKDDSLSATLWRFFQEKHGMSK